MDFDFAYTKKRREFGQPRRLIDFPPSVWMDKKPNPEETEKYIILKNVDKSVQTAPLYSAHEAQTEGKLMVERGMLHVEGGWPKEVNIKDEEQRERYRKKIQRSDSYVTSMMKLLDIMEDAILQNNALDIYEMYFDGPETYDHRIEPSVMILNAYGLEDAPKVIGLDWHPENVEELAVISNESPTTNIWEMKVPHEPLHSLTYTTSPPTCMKYHPKDNTIVTGHDNGQVAVWDYRTNGGPKSVSAPERSHRDTVTSLKWINTKVGTEFLSVSLDMTLKLWNSDDVKVPEEDFDVGVQLTYLEYDPSMPTRFTLGTGNGYVISGNRRGNTPQEKMPWKMKVCHGPVICIERNKAFSKILLTLGDGDVKIWSEDCRDTPIFTIPKRSADFAGAAWSPVRFGVLVCTRDDGYLEVWDFSVTRNRPLHVSWIDKTQLTAVCFNDAGDCLAIGGHNGNAYWVKLADNLTKISSEEKSELSAMFENDVSAYKALDSKLKEAKMKAQGGKDAKKGEDAVEGERGPPDDLGINPEQAALEHLNHVEHHLNTGKPDEFETN